ncbi:MAG TPA: acetyl-CoA carboxylase carboxyl transferase subunit beta, partial [Thermoanaerobaculia bacterium]|nr:acetyl-CoA carboxylase carboxyl transferase subunit beta [Thermoanaerobaculia bacterium]
MPEGLWVRCDDCREVLFARELERTLRVCPKCGHHFRIDAPERIRLLLDEGGVRELFAAVRPTDPLRFRDTRAYADRLHAYQQAVGRPDAVRVIEGTLAEQLPEGFQRAEFLQKHGFLDLIVPRDRMKAALGQLLALHAPRSGAVQPAAFSL